MFLLICLAAFGALFCIFYTGRLEMEARARDYRRKIHKRLLVRAPGAEKDLTCDLWSATYIIGRMKSKCDLCLSGDPYVSRIHAAMLYDGHTYRIKPICHTRAGRSYTSARAGETQAELEPVSGPGSCLHDHRPPGPGC